LNGFRTTLNKCVQRGGIVVKRVLNVLVVTKLFECNAGDYYPIKSIHLVTSWSNGDSVLTEQFGTTRHYTARRCVRPCAV